MKNYTLDLTYNLGDFENLEQALNYYGTIKASELAELVRENAELTGHDIEG